MSALTLLAFAETLSSNDDDYFNDTTMFLNLHSDNDFPPLSSSSTNWEIIIEDKDTFSEDSTVWVNGRSYAEAAADAGLQHHPIRIKDVVKTKPAKRQSTKITDISSFDDDQEDTSYQSKDMRRRKHETNAIIQGRRQKVLERAFHQAAYKYITSSSKNHYQDQLNSAIDRMKEACLYLEQTKGLQERIPETYYRCGRMRHIPYGPTRRTRHTKVNQYLTKENELKIFKQEIKEHPESKRIIYDVLNAYYGNSNDQRFYGTGPRFDFEELQYIATHFRCGEYIINQKIISKYESKIIPGLKDDYIRTLRKHVQVLSNMLPSPKDKSLCRISRTQYALAVLSLIKDNQQ